MVTGGPRTETAVGRERVAVAVDISGDEPVARCVDRSGASASSPRNGGAEKGTGRGPAGRHPEARDMPLISTFIRDPSSGARPGHPDGAGIARTSGRGHHVDLHARAGTRSKGRPESPRSAMSIAIHSVSCACNPSSFKCFAQNTALRSRATQPARPRWSGRMAV